MECEICKVEILNPESTKENINSKNIAVKVGSSYLCLPCSEVSYFLLEEPDKEVSKKVTKTVKDDKKNLSKNTNVYECIRCKNIYEGNKCNSCQMPNPLFMRTKKKTKRKKK